MTNKRNELIVGVVGLVIISVLSALMGAMIASKESEPCPTCAEAECPVCPLLSHEEIPIKLYPSASIACYKAPESQQWLCQPVIHQGKYGEPIEPPNEVTVRLVEPPEAAVKRNAENEQGK